MTTRTARKEDSMGFPPGDSYCPYCGWVYFKAGPWPDPWGRIGLVPRHLYDDGDCPGEGQNPRNPETDHRPLWKDLGVS